MDCAVAASGKLADRPQRRESESRRAKEDGLVSAQLTWRALDEAGEARTAANRPAFPLKLPRWSSNLLQRAYNRREFVFKMEIPAQRRPSRFWSQSRTHECLLFSRPFGYAQGRLCSRAPDTRRGEWVFETRSNKCNYGTDNP